MSSGTKQLDWWGSLKHGGLLIGPSALREYFSEPAPQASLQEAEVLRRALSRWESAASDGERVLLATVLETLCGFRDGTEGSWRRGAQVGTERTRRSLTGEAIKPRWLWQGPGETRLPIFVYSDVKRLGVGRGRRPISRVLEWLRGSAEPLALVTNLRQWRILYAGLDFDAWAEADIDLWFEAGQPGPQITALRTLLTPRTLTSSRDGHLGPLLAAIAASRKGQAELSSELGERVRRAVESLIDARGDALGRLVDQGATTPREIYLAASRIVMRLVVILFAESRDLLPRDNPIYHGSYGLEGLRDSLIRAGGAGGRARLRQHFGAWPRILGLMQLVREGSYHPDLNIPRYGGELFAPGSAEGPDGLSRALAALEDPEGPDDALVHDLLALLTRSRVKVRQGNSNVWIETAVDFSNLSSEYIGILYEGLLDFELRRSAPDDPMVFLALGKQPALPLSRLEAMDDKALKTLLESVKKDKDATVEDGAEAEDEEDVEGVEAEAEGVEADELDEVAEQTPAEVEAEPPDDSRRLAGERAHAWARRAVEAARIVRRPRANTWPAQQEYNERLEAAARGLIARVVVPGAWFLVRWGGTRKGSGTFYTRPQLAVPTVHRTLRPLACEPAEEVPPEQAELLPANRWHPRKPEEILALKVCDPAMGSGSFLVGALRYLTDTLYESLFHHDRLREHGDKTLVALVEGASDDDEQSLGAERLPARLDDEEFEPRLRARFKRYVVERCLYGIDVDPLAVELARLALWVETMDRDLPFEFLDHKLKIGNALIGTWFDRFRDYPAMAWEREGGDKGHSTAVHHEKESWTKAIKTFRNGLKAQLADWISGQAGVFDKIEGRQPDAIHDDALEALKRMHAFRIHETEEKAAFYREQIEANAAIHKLQEAMDTWCALWFWPPNALEHAPSPKTLGGLTKEARRIVADLAAAHSFFHWELEFPDVFSGRGTGFDAVLGNPPWDIQKPNSKEYFSNLDPLYRGYGKQEALDRQRELFEQDPAHERAWLEYNARFKALSNWCKHTGNPFGDPEAGARFPVASGKAGDRLHALWRDRRRKRNGYADPAHPFRHQGGGDINTYKLFLEAAHALLHSNGRLGMIAPAGLYTDKGTTELRELFVTRCRWRWLFGFENREGIFDIHRSFKFGPVIVEKGGETDAILTAFMHRDLGDWERAERHVIPYPRGQIEKFSPWTRAILEIRAERDLDVLDKIYSNAVLLGDDGPDGWGIKYATEFHMTNDSKLFKPRPWWEEREYKPDEYGRWIGPEGEVALPVYEGRMIGQFDFSKKGWVRGKGRGAVWRDIDWDSKVLEPQYLMALQTYRGRFSPGPCLKALMMDVTSSTNTRTVIASAAPDYPSGHKTPVLTSRNASVEQALQLVSILNTFVYDAAVRSRLGGNSLIWAVLEETPLPRMDPQIRRELCFLSARLSLTSTAFAPAWLYLRQQLGERVSRFPWKRLWALTTHERMRVRTIVDALSFAAFNLDCDDVLAILEGCDSPVAFSPPSVSAKGFWRVDKDKHPELRHTVLAIVAFNDLQRLVREHGGDRKQGILVILLSK